MIVILCADDNAEWMANAKSLSLWLPIYVPFHFINNAFSIKFRARIFANDFIDLTFSVAAAANETQTATAT